MKRRLIYALAGLVLLLSVAAGAVAAQIDGVSGLAGTINGDIVVVEDAAPSPAVISDRDYDGTVDTAVLMNGDIDVVPAPPPLADIYDGEIIVMEDAASAPPPALATTYDLENVLVSSY